MLHITEPEIAWFAQDINQNFIEATNLTGNSHNSCSRILHQGTFETLNHD